MAVANNTVAIIINWPIAKKISDRYGVVMKNGEEDLKKDAKYLTDSNDNDGVYKFLVQII